MGQNQTKLNSTEFKELLNGTKFSKEEINDWFTKFKAEFPRGRIRKYEFMVMYTKLFPDGDATEFTDHIFRTYDLDENGVIDFREFMVTVNIAQRGTKEEKLKWAFRLYDLDSNGKLTLREIETVLAAIYKAKRSPNPEERAKASAKEVLLAFDDNNDGSITEDEFVRETEKCESLKELLQGF